MKQLGVIIIAKNEENLIADCIESVKFADEIIVIDNSSTDRTREVAEHFGARVINFKSDDFSILRSVGLRSAKTKWVLYIDADERVTESLREDILSQLSISRVSYSAYSLQRKNFYFGNNEWPYIEKIERLFRKEKLKRWEGKLHESPVVEGEKGDLKGFLNHYTHRDLSSMVQKTLVWSKVEANLRFKANHPQMSLWRFPRVMLTAFYDSYIRQKGYKVGTIGIIESTYQAYSMFLTYARLWELQQKELTINNEQ